MEPQCGFCKKWGPLEQFGQLYHTRIKEKTVAAHHKCMVSSETRKVGIVNFLNIQTPEKLL